MRVVDVDVRALSLPLREPFVIASGRMTHTRAALVRITAEAGGKRATGLGEAAALPPVTAEDQPDLLRGIGAARPKMLGAAIDAGAFDDAVRQAAGGAAGEGELAAFLDELGLGSVARAAVECALLDAHARLCGVPLHRLLGGGAVPLVSDITLPIGDPEHLAELAAGYRARGFRSFKVKVGKDRAEDEQTLAALIARVPDARVRLDANGGFDAAEALALIDEAIRLGVALECFEQPCARADLEGMARVAADGRVLVVADESCRSLADLEAIVAARAAGAINLKLAKMGGICRALAIGRRARACGLELMAGAMVESRLGLSAMAHLVCGLGGVAFVDLDTAFLLAEDPFRGGYHADGPTLTLAEGPGLAIELAADP